MKKIKFVIVMLFLLFMAFTMLYGIDYRTRAWVIAYVKDTQGGIDTVLVHYTDSLQLKRLVGDWATIDTIIVPEYADIDSGDFEEINVANYVNADSFDGREALIDTAWVKTLFVYNTDTVTFNHQNLYDIDTIGGGAGYAEVPPVYVARKITTQYGKTPSTGNLDLTESNKVLMNVDSAGYTERDSLKSFTWFEADSGDFQHGVVDVDLNLSGCNIIFVPLTGDIQTYVDAADAGATLILASGEYTITDTINIDKQLNIIGQGNAGFATTPVTPSHGTLISSSTANMVAFHIGSDNVRISHLSINMTGAASLGVSTVTDLTGLVLNNIDVLITATGLVKGFDFYGSNVVMRDLTFYITSSDGSAAGVLFYNNSSTGQDAICDCFNVTGTVVGASGYAYAMACYNINDANTLTMNLSNSVCKALAGTAADVAVISYSTTTSNATVNAYMCTFEGENFDAFQNNSNALNLGGSVLVNGTVSGTVTYRATMVSDAATVDSLDAQHGVFDVHILTDSLNSEHIIGDFFVSEVTSCSIDSFKVNGAADTLFFFVGGVKFAAKKP